MQRDIEFIQGLVNHIELNLDEEINVLKLAHSFAISPWHFQRMFKSLIGDTLGGYIRGRRLTRAAQLLLESELGIIDIAFSVGFNSHEAFTRSFKAYFKLSPKLFRHNRPVVLMKNKPILSQDLFQHIDKEITREPVIKTRQAHSIIGFSTVVPSPFLSNDRYCDMLYDSWMKLLDQQNNIPQRIAETYYGLSISASGNFTEEEVDYIAGVPVVDLAEVPEGMVSYDFPEQMIAMFAVSTVDKDIVSKTMDYIYGYWLPNSPYQRGEGNDYELFEGVTDFEAPGLSSKYVIPIEPK